MLVVTILTIIFTFRNSAYFVRSMCSLYYSDINSII